MSEREESCAARIGGELERRLASIEEMKVRLEAAQDAENYDEADDIQEEVSAYPLSVDVERVVTIQISTGGPGDQFEYTLDRDGDITEIRYRFLDWFDGAAQTIGYDTPRHELAKWFFEQIVPDPESL